jgi:hypothetical protein
VLLQLQEEKDTIHERSIQPKKKKEDQISSESQSINTVQNAEVNFPKREPAQCRSMTQISQLPSTNTATKCGRRENDHPEPKIQAKRAQIFGCVKHQHVPNAKAE